MTEGSWELCGEGRWARWGYLAVISCRRRPAHDKAKKVCGMKVNLQV